MIRTHATQVQVTSEATRRSAATRALRSRRSVRAGSGSPDRARDCGAARSKPAVLTAAVAHVMSGGEGGDLDQQAWSQEQLDARDAETQLRLVARDAETQLRLLARNARRLYERGPAASRSCASRRQATRRQPRSGRRSTPSASSGHGRPPSAQPPRPPCTPRCLDTRTLWALTPCPRSTSCRSTTATSRLDGYERRLADLLVAAVLATS